MGEPTSRCHETQFIVKFIEAHPCSCRKGKLIKLRELKAKKDLSSSEYDMAVRILESEDHEENCGKCKEGMVHEPVIKEDADGNIVCSVVRPENGMYDGFSAIRIYTTPGEQLNEKQNVISSSPSEQGETCRKPPKGSH